MKKSINNLSDINTYFERHLIEVAREKFLEIHSKFEVGKTDFVTIHNWGWEDGELKVLFDTSMDYGDSDGTVEFKAQGYIYPNLPVEYWYLG